MFVYAKTPEICDLIGQIILCAKECVFELAWRCQFWPGSILHFYLALPGLDEKNRQLNLCPDKDKNLALI